MDIARQIFRLAMLGAVNHQITHIVVVGSVFAELRTFCAGCHQKLGQLVNCHLCFGTWVGFLLAWLFRPRLIVPPTVSGPTRRPRIRTLVAFVADAFAIALAGRFFTEVLAVLANRAAIERRQKELLERRAAGHGARAETETAAIG